VGLALEHAEPLARPAGLVVERGEPARDRELLGLRGAAGGRGLDQQRDRALDVGQALEPGPRGLAEQADLAGRVARRARGGGDTVGVAIVVSAALGELAQLLLGRRRARAHREQRGVVIHRGGQIVELGEPRAGLLVQRPAPGGVERDDLLEHADHLARPRGAVVVRAQQVERGVADGLAGGRRLEHALEQLGRLAIVVGLGEQRLGGGESALRIAEVVEPDLGDAQPAALAFFLGLAVEPALPQVDQLGPALVALEQALEALADLSVLGRERQQLLVVADRLVGLVGDVLGELRGLAQQPGAAGPIPGRLDRAVVDAERVVPALGVGVEQRQPGERGVGRRRQRADADQDLLEDRGLLAEPPVAELPGALADHLGDLGLEVAAERRIVELDHIVGSLEIIGESLGFFPCAHGVRRMLDGGGGFLELRQIGHGLPEWSRRRRCDPARRRKILSRGSRRGSPGGLDREAITYARRA